MIAIIIITCTEIKITHRHFSVCSLINKKLSYRRETARQLPTWGVGARPSSPPTPPPLATAMHMVESETGNKRTPSVTSIKRTESMNRAFKVIQVHPIWCRQESRVVCRRNVQLMPTLFLKLTKIWQRENGKFVDFNDPTQVWRRPSKKPIPISTNDLYCQKLELLTYIFAADSMGLYSLVFTQLCLKIEPSESKTASAKTEFYMK